MLIVYRSLSSQTLDSCCLIQETVEANFKPAEPWKRSLSDLKDWIYDPSVVLTQTSALGPNTPFGSISDGPTMSPLPSGSGARSQRSLTSSRGRMVPTAVEGEGGTRSCGAYCEKGKQIEKANDLYV